MCVGILVHRNERTAVQVTTIRMKNILVPVLVVMKNQKLKASIHSFFFSLNCTFYHLDSNLDKAEHFRQTRERALHNVLKIVLCVCLCVYNMRSFCNVAHMDLHAACN